MTLVALDTSVAVPLLLDTHPAHARVVTCCRGRRCAMSGHALAETYSALTRLSGDARSTASDAARLLRQSRPPIMPEPERSAQLPGVLAGAGISGGAVYDARARSTYEALGATVVAVSLSTRSPRDGFRSPDGMIAAWRHGEGPVGRPGGRA